MLHRLRTCLPVPDAPTIALALMVMMTLLWIAAIALLVVG